MINSMPEGARQLVLSSLDLYARVKRLDDALDSPQNRESPARSMLEQLHEHF